MPFSSPWPRRFALTVLLFAAACKTRSPVAVAAVGGQPITREEFEEELRRVRTETGDLILQKEVLSSLKSSVLNQMIEKRLVLSQTDNYGVQVTDGALDAELRRIASDYPEDGFAKSVKENFVNEGLLRQRIRESIVMDRVVEEALGKSLEPDEQELLRYFRSKAGEFSLPERVHLRQIVVRSRDEAEALRVRVQAGESFIELAKKHSLTPDGAKGGDVGIFAKGEMPPEFNQAFNLNIGEVSPVVQSSYGYHLFWVVEKLPPRIPTFDDVRVEVRARMLGERKENAYRTWLKGLREQTGVRVYQDVVDSIE